VVAIASTHSAKNATQTAVLQQAQSRTSNAQAKACTSYTLAGIAYY
jgi:hypothetical protein